MDTISYYRSRIAASIRLLIKNRRCSIGLEEGFLIRSPNADSGQDGLPDRQTVECGLSRIVS